MCRATGGRAGVGPGSALTMRMRSCRQECLQIVTSINWLFFLWELQMKLQALRSALPLPHRCWCKRGAKRSHPVHKGDERRGSSPPPRREIVDYTDRRRGRCAFCEGVSGA